MARIRLAVVGMVLVILAAGPVPWAAAGPDPAQHARIVDSGVRFLVTRAQAPDGSFSKALGSGPTSLAVAAMLRSGRSPGDPAVAKGLKYLETCVRSDGGIYGPSGMLGNYETCAAVMCFQEANGDGHYEDLLDAAQAYLRGNQWGERKEKESSDFEYGGASYGGNTRPDLSNTAFLVDALKSCGTGSEDEAIQKAFAFVSRCQNLETEHNTTPFASKVNDGGFYYTCVISRQDKDRMTPNGGLRSYGSMSYAGLKEDDPRVQAAVTWIRRFYDLETNPGMGSAGLYYYYHTFAKALAVLGDDSVEDTNGVKHDWRRELTEELAQRQQENGSWVNTESKRWMEGDANLVTAFALLALSYCQPVGS